MRKKLPIFLIQSLFILIILRAQTYYYRCDESFSVFEEIPVESITKFDFYMKKVILENGQEQYFFRNQSLQRKIIIKNEEDKTIEETWIEDKLDSSKTYKKNRLIFEKYFSKIFNEFETMDYTYINDKLIKIDVKRDSGISYTIEYIYDSTGIIKAIMLNKKIINLTAFLKSSIFASWNRGEFIVEYYNENMLLSKRDIYSTSGELVAKEILIYENSTLTSISFFDYSNNTVVNKYFAKNLLQEERKENTKNNAVIYIKQFIYNEKMLCIKTIQIEGKNTKVVEFEYDDDGKKNLEKSFINGRLTQIMQWISESEYFIEYYEKDGIILKVYYTNGKKTKEEAWQNNALLFEKNYQ